MTQARLQGTLRINEFIEMLEQLQIEHGNLPVYIDDPSTGWLLGLDINYCAQDEATEHNNGVETPACLVIEGEYSS